jgi:DNA-directed RNA polymerase specialized sigma24 family protein
MQDAITFVSEPPGRPGRVDVRERALHRVRLPATQRQVVELAYFEGLTCREVANAVGIPEGTAKSRLRLALAKLEAVLDRQLLESS